MGKKALFLETHETINKIIFSEENGIEVLDIYYILKPLYNEALHINERTSIQNRIKIQLFKNYIIEISKE